MDDSLKTESEKLTRSWMQHESAKLRDYLVRGVEDPRINLQSILSRHFLVQASFGNRFEALMQAEYRFSAVMNWLVKLAQTHSDPEELEAVLHALRRKADNAEGIEVPLFVLQSFASLPALAGEVTVPDYVSAFLAETKSGHCTATAGQPSLDTFRHLWQRTFLGQAAVDFGRENMLEGSAAAIPLARVLEAACGSANDYRFIHSYGQARFIEYTGLDLCAKNVENARALFPGVRFEQGNVFELPAPDKTFDFTFTHDLFEHLSPPGLEVAVKELCRVTSRGICVGFFNMNETRDHVVQPLDEYHWNTLSMARTRELFTQQGFVAQVVHIGTFLQQQIGCEETHNPNAYTFLLRPLKLAAWSEHDPAITLPE